MFQWLYWLGYLVTESHGTQACVAGADVKLSGDVFDEVNDELPVVDSMVVCVPNRTGVVDYKTEIRHTS